mmetsp:Transcript_25690/g.86157  ORF Transcript_25690/g.86157 Transcript_25690/m.86157 type:complete len:273 (-) Transcript_25690:199-1017(-)
MQTTEIDPGLARPALQAPAAAPATVPAAAREILPGFKVDVSHQEVDQLLTELEEIYKNQPTEWLSVSDIGQMLAHMFYEDVDELEDALKGTFADFVCALPHCETREEGGKLLFRLRPDPPASERRQMKITVRVSSGEDLHRVLLKAPAARIEVPSMEFEIGTEAKRSINTLYNHLAQAKQNLALHAEMNTTRLPAEHHLRILETTEQLEKLLDVDEPYDLVVHDPSGLSELKPAEGAAVEYGGEAVDPPEGTGVHAQFGAMPDPTADFADAD